MKTTDKPLDPEKKQKEEATRKKFELLRFGELRYARLAPKDLGMWRYFCVYVVDETLIRKRK